MTSKLKDYLEEHGFIRNQNAEALGVSRAMLSYLVKTGELLRVSQGVYSLPDGLPDDLQLIAASSPKIIFSHETALLLHGLHNRIPEKNAVTVPQGFTIPAGIAGKVKSYRVKPENHEMGKSTATTFMGHSVPCYDPERTICDIIRSYSRVDIETYGNALRTYVKYPQRNYPRLMEYARALGIEKKVAKTMEVLA